MIIAETDRLILKEFSIEDTEGFYRLNNDPLVLQYTGDKPFANVDETKRFIESYNHYQKHGFGRWSVYIKSENKYVGFCGLRVSEESGETDIGFRILREYWRKGIGYESSVAALELGFNQFKLENIVARAMKDNLASHGVIKKLGMLPVDDFVEEGVSWTQYNLSAKEFSLATR